MRQYLVGSWNNADEYDYSGEQLMGSRHAGRSVCVDHMLPNGKANLARYVDVEQKPKAIKKKKASEQVDLAERNLNRLEKMSVDLDDEYYSGELSQDRYELLRYKMDKRLIAAWERLEKENAVVWQKEDQQWEIEKSNEKSSNSWTKSIEKSLIDGNGWLTLALKDCSENNVFLRGFLAIKGLYNFLKG